MGRDALSTRIRAIDKKLAGLTPINSEEHCIFKVHKQLFKVNEKAYKPVLLAIGPYNDHKKVGQGLMEEHKLRYLKQMLIRRNESSVEACISALTKLEEKARNCYAERFRLNTYEFVEMMLLDGCFIIELFRRTCLMSSQRDEHDPIFKLDWMLPKIARDLLLFENQLPYFVLTKLFEMSPSSQVPPANPSGNFGEHTINIEQNNEIRLSDLAIYFFSGSLSFQDWDDNGSRSYSTKQPFLFCRTHKTISPPLAKMVHEHLEVGYKFKNAKFKHLLDLMHNSIRLSVLDMELDRATEHQEVGVKFKKGVVSPLPAKMENMKKGICYAIKLQKSRLKFNITEIFKFPYRPKKTADWMSVPYGAELQAAGVEFKMAEKFRNKLEENRSWESIPDAIAFQDAGIELEKAKMFLDLLAGRNSRNEDVKSELCGAKFKMVERFMRLPFLNKTGNWNSIPQGTELKDAKVEFKKAKKFRETKNMMKLRPNATEAKEAGVKFKKGKQCTPFAIKFSNGVLEISPLSVEDETETFLRNLIAYEQYSPDNDSNYVTDYMCFMDDLIDSPKDVELLRRKGIIENWLGEDEVVSTMVNKLGHHITFSPSNSIYVKASIDMNKHCAKQGNVWMAKLKHNYFHSPWALLSVLAAILLLGLAITQTVFTIIR